MDALEVRGNEVSVPKDAFTSLLPDRYAFDHRITMIPKAYPDSQLLLERRGISRDTIERGSFWQINIYATELFALPDELFWETEVNWHRQQLDVKGLIAAAGLWVFGSTVMITVLQSDVCQQLYRHAELKRSCKTVLERHFKYWYVMLFNAVLNFCLDRDIVLLYCPTGDQVIKSTRKRVAPELFTRIYDNANRGYRCSRTILNGAEYWKLAVKDNSDRIIRPVLAAKPDVPPRQSPIICLFHDIEENIDTPISTQACEANLRSILEIENKLDIYGTFDVVGTMFARKRDIILSADDRHSLAFHTFNHKIGEPDQLPKCRVTDLRVRGYRPAQSKITAELTNYNLTFHNFEWLASSSQSLGQKSIELRDGLIKIPIHLDDYSLFRGDVDYRYWESKVLDLAAKVPVFGLGLHDCYAQHWLPHYPSLLEKLQKIGQFCSADEICNITLLDSSYAATFEKVATKMPSQS